MTVSRFPRLMLLTLVTVSCGGAADGSAAIVPVRSLSSVAIAWNGKPLAQGTTVQMNAVAKDNQGAELPTGVVTWTSSDPASASVSAKPAGRS